MWAGALAVGLPAALLAIIESVRAVAEQNNQLETYLLATAFLAGAGALAGAIVAALSALVGRWRYRKAHAEELAALTAQRAAARAQTPKRRMSAKRRAFFWLMLAAVFAVIMAPSAIAYVVSNALTTWEGLVVAVGALVIGFGALRLGKRTDWPGYLYDVVGAIFMASGLILGIGEITGYAVPLLAGLGELIFLMRAIDRDLNNLLGIRMPSATDPPEPEPVFFRNDGESIVVYPSRRKLAGHAAFAGGVALVFGALTFVFRAADPMIVFGLGAFAAMGLLGFIPDLARLLHRWPTLTVTSDGIIDRGSGLITGFGLIPWHEIEDVRYGLRPTKVAVSELLIAPVNFERLIARQPLVKRPLLRFGSAMRGGEIAISPLYFAQSPAEVATRIQAYVRSHAPVSYLEQEDAAWLPPSVSDDSPEAR